MKKFVVALGAGWKDAINDPKSAIAALVKRNPAADSALEQRRLELAIKANVLSDYVKENGMGGIDNDDLLPQFSSCLKHINVKISQMLSCISPMLICQQVV